MAMAAGCEFWGLGKKVVVFLFHFTDWWERERALFHDRFTVTCAAAFCTLGSVAL